MSSVCTWQLASRDDFSFERVLRTLAELSRSIVPGQRRLGEWLRTFQIWDLIEGAPEIETPGVVDILIPSLVYA